MSDEKRDTQFAGFASLLIDELMQVNSIDDRTTKEQIMAQRAYDFACHIARHISSSKADYMEAGSINPDEAVSGGNCTENVWCSGVPIPDMTEWPEEK